MLNMSFALTTPQILKRTKTVTRRIGWFFLKPGTLIQAVEKGMGLKKGEKMHKLAVIRVKDVRREPLGKMLDVSPYGVDECVREGFPELAPAEFVTLFKESHRILIAVPDPVRCRRGRYRQCNEDDSVTRIEFEYVD